jgi:hypothetical protein
LCTEEPVSDVAALVNLTTETREAIASSADRIGMFTLFAEGHSHIDADEKTGTTRPSERLKPPVT